MVSRILSPGCKVDHMVILEGFQGTGKSTAVSIIGGKWFAQMNSNIDSKDFLVSMRGKMMIEMGELSSMRKAEADKIKQIVSEPKDNYRPPYGRTSIDFPRQCVFIGTTNQAEYLIDDTGARRFWPMETSRIDNEKLREDRDQLFAEALDMRKRGVKWWEVPEEAEAIQEARREQDPWEYPITVWVDQPLVNPPWSTAYIADEAVRLPVGNQNRQTSNRIAKIMRSLGYVYKPVKGVKMWKKQQESES